MGVRRIALSTLLFFSAYPICIRSQDQGDAPERQIGAVYDSVAEAGLNHRSRVIKDDSGRETSRYLELASGLNRFNPETGNWDEAQAKLEVFEGGVLSRQTCFDLILAPSSDDPNGVFDVLFPLMPGQQEQDRGRVRGQCIGIAMTDPTTGRSTWVSEVSDVAGLVADNEVTYVGCFKGERGFSASLTYSVRISGVAQDVIFHTGLPTPSDMGFEPVIDQASGQFGEPPVAIEVWTQLLNAPRATLAAEVLPTGDADTRIDFGGMELARGTAFPLDTESPNRVALLGKSIPVSKEYRQINGMQFLIESVPYSRIAQETAKLKPLAALHPLRQKERQSALASSFGRARAERHFPISTDRREEATRPERSALAMARPERGKTLAMAGYVLDYDMNAGFVTNFTFHADTTFYIKGAVTLKQTTTLEGGSVCKFKDNTASLVVDSAGTLVVVTQPYHPVMFVSKDDNSVGNSLPDGTNTISGTYANPALSYLPSAPLNLSYINVRNAKQGIFLNNGSSANVIKHAQFVHCEQGIVGTSAGAKVRNALFSDVTNVLVGTSSAYAIEHVTARGATNLLVNNGGSSLAATNSIFVNVTNFFSSMTGTNNVTNSSATAVFQEVGAAQHYLQDAYRNLGTPNVDPTLAGELKLKTTYPPLLVMNTTVNTASSTISVELGAWNTKFSSDEVEHSDQIARGPESTSFSFRCGKQAV